MKIALLLILAALTCHAQTQQEKIIAVTILGEARGEGEAGMYAVACVIAQRAQERKMSADKVCTQKLQFSCNNNGINYRLLETPQAKYALTLASNINNLDTEFVKRANHYCTTNINPYWSKGKTPVKIIGNHKFYKL